MITCRKDNQVTFLANITRGFQKRGVAVVAYDRPLNIDLDQVDVLVSTDMVDVTLRYDDNLGTFEEGILSYYPNIQYDQIPDFTSNHMILIAIPEDQYPKWELAVRLRDVRPFLKDTAYESVWTPEGYQSALALLARRDDFLECQRFLYLTRNEVLAELRAVLADYHTQLSNDHKRDLMTQEEQIEAFFDFSDRGRQLVETVPDDAIDFMKKSQAYQESLKCLQEANFALSETQQTNVLHQVGAMRFAKEHVAFNLSDMGAGKTLMTVQAIHLMDWQAITHYVLGDIEKELWLPAKRILAPKLSIQSSWLKTFETFYKVIPISEDLYELQLEHQGTLYRSHLSLHGFTVTSTGVHLDTRLPYPESTSIREFLVVDEIHQLSNLRTASRLFEYGDPRPKDLYDCFVLSGTLANLTVGEWYRLNRIFQFIDFDTTESDQLSQIKNQISHRVDMVVMDGYEFEPVDNPIVHTVSEVQRKLSAVESAFYWKYAPFSIAAPNRNVRLALQNKAYSAICNPDLLDGVNFPLFYKIVGHRAVTASADQVAVELFGDIATQHEATLIKTPSALSHDDLTILKDVYRVIADHNLYKSPTIADSLASALLNLNDGLGTKTLYDVLVGHLERNTRFRNYLAGKSGSLLERLQASQLLVMPKLQDTVKFHALKDVLEKHQSDTVIIVVNDIPAMKTLGKALNVPVFTPTQTRDMIGYQDLFDQFFAQQSVVIAPQFMLKSSLDLVQANVLVQFQLNLAISDMIQTQNRINRIGQTRETNAYYIATNELQENLIQLFIDTYRNVKVAHKGIVELFVSLDQQLNVVTDYLGKAFDALDEAMLVTESESTESESTETPVESIDATLNLILEGGILMSEKIVGTTFVDQPDFKYFAGELGHQNGVDVKTCPALLIPEPDNPYDKSAVAVYTKLINGAAHRIGYLAKHSSLKPITSTKIGTLDIYHYSPQGLNDSYQIR